MRHISNAIGTGLAAFALAAMATMAPGAARAEQGAQRTVIGEAYVPTIWTDPDGCEHWVMDDGWEGYMTPHVTRQGIPVCRRGNTCAVMNSDQLFATDSYRISHQGKAMLAKFFRGAGATSYVIAGHTDSRASDDYNMRLSINRANSVAAGGTRRRRPHRRRARLWRADAGRQQQDRRTGMQKNRRVEIICIR